MPVRIVNPKPPATEEAIAEAESRIGLGFPADYRQFLKTHNGGRPEPGGFDIRWRAGQLPADDWRRSGMGWFYAINSPVDATDLLEQNTVTLRGRLPAHTAAIGHDAGGNQLLLATEGPFAGQLLFWCKDHEAGDGNKPGWDNVGQVADSFQDFIDHRLG